MKNKAARKLKEKQEPYLKVVPPEQESADNIVAGPGMDKDKRKKKKGRRIKVIVLTSVIILIAAGVGIFIYFRNQNAKGDNREGFAGFSGRNASASTFMVTGDMVAASGVINVGTETDDLGVELSSSLKIEEVYVSSGDKITAGTAILKLNEDDVKAARKELESALKSAELSARAGAIEYEQNLITAKYDYDSAILAGKQAKAVYESTVASLSESVERAQNSLDEAEDKIAEYQSYINEDYSSYFGVDDAQATYDEHLALLKARIEEWGVSWNEVTGRKSMNLATEHDQYVYILQELYSVLEKDLEKLETAQSKYDDATENASLDLQTLQLSLPSLKEELAKAKENYDTKTAQAKLTYETSLYNAERAESDYETNLEKIESDYEELKDAYEDAKENLAAFEDLIGDGVFYASGSGTVLRMMARAGQSISGESSILSYSDTTEMTVTVSVDQTDIAKLNVGDSAYLVSSNDMASYEGVVRSINPVTSSDSRTNVTYNVKVEVTGDTEGLVSNETVTVIFGADAATIENLLNQSGSSGSGMNRPTDGEMPNFGDGETPDFGNMPDFGSIGDGERPSFGGGNMPGNGNRGGRSDRNGGQ